MKDLNLYFLLVKDLYMKEYIIKEIQFHNSFFF